MALTTCPASTGVATPMPAPITTVTRKTEMSRRYGRANRMMRRVVPRVSWCSLIRSASRIDRSIVQLDQLLLGPNSLTSRRSGTILPAGYDNSGR